MTARKRRRGKDENRDSLLEEAWSIIKLAKAGGHLAIASATLERAARIAGVWSEKSGGDAGGEPLAQVFTSEPMTPEQWSEKFAPKD